MVKDLFIQMFNFFNVLQLFQLEPIDLLQNYNHFHIKHQLLQLSFQFCRLLAIEQLVIDMVIKYIHQIMAPFYILQSSRHYYKELQLIFIRISFNKKMVLHIQQFPLLLQKVLRHNFVLLQQFHLHIIVHHTQLIITCS